MNKDLGKKLSEILQEKENGQEPVNTTQENWHEPEQSDAIHGSTVDELEQQPEEQPEEQKENPYTMDQASTEHPQEEFIKNLNRYIGVKIVDAKAMSGEEFQAYKGISVGTGPGYLVVYTDGYKSWSPKEVFELAYRPAKALIYGLAYEAAREGKTIARRAWIDPETGMPKQVVTMQVPSMIPEEVIPKMTSLNDDFKAFAKMYLTALSYKCQMLLVKVPSGVATSYVPDTFDMAASDWFVVNVLNQ